MTQPKNEPRRWEIFCSQANHFINGPDTNGAMVVVAEPDYDAIKAELRSRDEMHEQHVQKIEAARLRAIAELQRERRKVEKAVEALKDIKAHCRDRSVPQGVEYLKCLSISASTILELEAIDKEGAEPKGALK